jgi:ammonia channel protein AmtB
VSVAVRLAQLLPQDGGDGWAPPTDAVRVYVGRSLLWLVWVGFAITVSLMPPRDRLKGTDPSLVASSSSAISASESHVLKKN